MKKIILGILIASSILCIVGCGGASAASSNNNSNGTVTKDVKVDPKSQDEKIKEIVKNMKWEVKKDEIGSKTIEGTFENTTGEKIDYLELEYKLYNKSGEVIDSSFTNETNIAPGEKRKIEILPAKDDFTKYEITPKLD